MKTKILAATVAALITCLTLAGCTSHPASAAKTSSASEATSKPASFDFSKPTSATADVTVRDSKLHDSVRVLKVDTTFDGTKLHYFDKSQGPVILVKTKISSGDEGYSVAYETDIQLKGSDGDTSNTVDYDNLKQELKAAGYPLPSNFVETGKSSTGWLPFQLTARSQSELTLTLAHGKLDSIGTGAATTVPAASFSETIAKNSGTVIPATQPKVGTVQTIHTVLKDPVLGDKVTADGLVTDFPLPAGVPASAGHLVLVHISATPGTKYLSGFAETSLSILDSVGTSNPVAFDAVVNPAVAAAGYPLLPSDGSVAPGNTGSGWVPFFVTAKALTGLQLNLHRDAASTTSGKTITEGDTHAMLGA